MFDIERIKSECDIETVAEAIGMDVKPKSEGHGRTWLICPNPYHNDHNFGSCYCGTDKNGYEYWTCRACGAHGDVIKMVQLFKDVSFNEACQIICDTFGGVSSYKIKNKEEASEIRRVTAEKKLLPDKEILEILNLSPAPVYETVGVYGKYDSFDVEKGCIKEDVPRKSDDEPELTEIKKRIASNALLNLKLNDLEAYEWLIQNKCKEAVQRFEDLKDACRPYQSDPERSKCIVDWSKACDKFIKKINDVFIENGGVLEKKKKRISFQI